MSHHEMDLAEDEEDWEYQYDANQTEDFYVTLDLTSYALPLSKAQKAAVKARSASKPATSTAAPATGATNISASDTGTASFSQHPTNTPASANTPRLSYNGTPAVSSSSSTNPQTRHVPIKKKPDPPQLKFLNLDKQNPLIEYAGSLYRCNWTSILGTDIIVADNGSSGDKDSAGLSGKGVEKSSIVATTPIRLVAQPVSLETPGIPKVPKPKPPVIQRQKTVKPAVKPVTTQNRAGSPKLVKNGRHPPILVLPSVASTPNDESSTSFSKRMNGIKRSKKGIGSNPAPTSATPQAAAPPPDTSSTQKRKRTEEVLQRTKAPPVPSARAPQSLTATAAGYLIQKTATASPSAQRPALSHPASSSTPDVPSTFTPPHMPVSAENRRFVSLPPEERPSRGPGSRGGKVRPAGSGFRTPQRVPAADHRYAKSMEAHRSTSVSSGRASETRTTPRIVQSNEGPSDALGGIPVNGAPAGAVNASDTRVPSTGIMQSHVDILRAAQNNVLGSLAFTKQAEETRRAREADRTAKAFEYKPFEVVPDFSSGTLAEKVAKQIPEGSVGTPADGSGKAPTEVEGKGAEKAVEETVESTAEGVEAGSSKDVVTTEVGSVDETVEKIPRAHTGGFGGASGGVGQQRGDRVA